MAGWLVADKATGDSAKPDDKDFLDGAMKRYDRAYERERVNIADAYDDLEFRAGNQWPEEIKSARELDHRPVLTINRVPQFVRQVTGDIRMMRPSIKVVPVDSRGDPKTAEVEAGLIRYIENRSDAQHAYTQGVDSQVVSGIGHWRVATEYSDDSTFNQEIRILGIEDGVSVLWDPDAVFPNKEDAGFCFVPVDLSRASYEEQWPDAPITDLDRPSNGTNQHTEWCGDDFVRIAEYWEKRKEKRLLGLLSDGSIDDLTGEPDVEIEKAKAAGVRLEEREGSCVYRSLITQGYVLEKPVKWSGRYIPIVPVIGEEVRIGRRVVRHGVVRYAKDPQRMYNYFRSTQTEVIALQPKAPFVGTAKQFEGYEVEWESANTKAWPYLRVNSDPAAPGLPTRVAPPVASSGIDDGLATSAEEMKAVTGIYDAGLGNRSNETSGKAILARQKEGDVGTFVYVDNFSRALRHTGRILLDLIPHVYDTERTIRIVGEDGKVDLAQINKPQVTGTTPDGDPIQEVMHDVTVGAYDVVLEQGPSYSTKREEAKDGMMQFVQAAPQLLPLVADLIAKSQDWPMAEEFSKRLEFALPPPVKAAIDQEKGPQQGQQGQPPAPPQPDPQQIAQQHAAQMQMQVQEAQAQSDVATSQSDVRVAQLKEQQEQINLEIKQVELQIAQAKAHAAMQPPQQNSQAGTASARAASEQRAALRGGFFIGDK